MSRRASGRVEPALLPGLLRVSTGPVRITRYRLSTAQGGVELERFGIEHTAAGLLRLTDRLGRAGVVEVGIERPDGPVVDALLAAALTVFVIAPNRVKSLRGRYGSAGNMDDRFDALVLADTVRTDRARLQALKPDSAATVTLRMTVRGPQGPGRSPGCDG